jgi:hypothetical protein
MNREAAAARGRVRRYTNHWMMKIGDGLGANAVTRRQSVIEDFDSISRLLNLLENERTQSL